jgi:predicted RNA-binding Zn ribbon-like protein
VPAKPPIGGLSVAIWPNAQAATLSISCVNARAARRRSPAPFLLLGEPLAIDLINTLVPAAYGGDLLATPSRVTAWIEAEEGRLPAGTTQGTTLSVDEVRRLREALRAVFQAVLAATPPPQFAIARLNAASRAAAAYSHLEWRPDGHPSVRLRFPSAATRPATAFLGAIVRSAIDLLTGPDLRSLRHCEGPGCSLLFVVRGRQRRWCSPFLCGNRVRVARHQRRKVAGTEPGSE